MPDFGWQIDEVGVYEDAGDVGGDHQAGPAFQVRFINKITPYAVIDMYLYAAQVEEDGETVIRIEEQNIYTICSDVTDIGMTELWTNNDYELTDQTFKTVEEATDEARRIAHMADASDYVWAPFTPPTRVSERDDPQLQRAKQEHAAAYEALRGAYAINGLPFPADLEDQGGFIIRKPDGTVPTPEELAEAMDRVATAKEYQLDCPQMDPPCNGRIEAKAPLYIGISTDGMPYVEGVGWHEDPYIGCSKGGEEHVSQELWDRLSGVLAEFCAAVENRLGAEMGEDQIKKQQGG